MSFLIKFIHYLDYNYYFPMNNVIDDVVMGDINITLHNDLTLVDGVHGKALFFNGINQWADLGTHP